MQEQTRDSGAPSSPNPRGRRKTLLLTRAALPALALVAVLLAPIGAGGEAQSQPAAAQPPNFVVFMADDMREDQLQYLPKTKKLLGGEGARFTNAVQTYTLCCPSRATFLTGLYPHNHGVEHNRSPSGATRFRESGYEGSTVAAALDLKGYRTALLGKYLNGYDGPHVPPGWDRWFAHTGGESDSWEPTYYDSGENRRVRARSAIDAQTLAYQAERFIRYNSGPKFMYVAYHGPHEPYQPPPEYRDDYRNERVPRTPAFNERDISDKPGWLRKARPRPFRESFVQKVDEGWRKKARTLRGMDNSVARVVAALREKGELSNTYLLFTSDHGSSSGEHRLRGKTSAYRTDAELPLLLRGPKVARGSIRSHLVGNHDFAPTILDLANAEPLAQPDGRSFAKALPAEGSPGFVSGEDYRARLLVANREHPNRDSSVPGYSVLRSRDSFFARYNVGGGYQREFYNLDRDPHMVENSWSRLAPEKQAGFSNRLANLRNCRAEECRKAEG